jgi:hypothetical protein
VVEEIRRPAPLLDLDLQISLAGGDLSYGNPSGVFLVRPTIGGGDSMAPTTVASRRVWEAASSWWRRFPGVGGPAVAQLGGLLRWRGNASLTLLWRGVGEGDYAVSSANQRICGGCRPS